MIHDGNKIFGDARSEESIQLISKFLVGLHKDKDENSLWVRFNSLMNRAFDQQISSEATFKAYIKVLAENKQNKTSQSKK